MIRKLQKRFILITVLALTVAMVLVVGIVNLANLASVRGELADTVRNLAGDELPAFLRAGRPGETRQPGAAETPDAGAGAGDLPFILVRGLAVGVLLFIIVDEHQIHALRPEDGEEPFFILAAALYKVVAPRGITHHVRERLQQRGIAFHVFDRIDLVRKNLVPILRLCLIGKLLFQHKGPRLNRQQVKVHLQV